MDKKHRKEEAAMGAGELHPQDMEFVDPPQDESEGSDSDFEEPVSEEAGPAEPSAQLKQARDQIEGVLARGAALGIKARASEGDGANVVGVGLSEGACGGTPGESCLVVFVENPAEEEQVRRELHDSMGARAASDDQFPVQVIVTGPIEALSSNRSRIRPAAGGLSCGHPLVTAGTIGGWARGRGSRANRRLLVTNNHVAAASNKGKYGDSILQPGKADGGSNPADRIAILERFVKIAFGGAVNYVDCATGWCWPQLVRTDHVYHLGTKPIYFKIGSAPKEPTVNQIVGKTGRTTNLTQGRITATGVSINVNFGSAGVAHFRDQIAVHSTNAAPFSAGGDSGSFVWTWDTQRRPVGLLFAGGGGVTFCNRITRVISALDITL